MSAWTDFLSQIADAREITLVGPLYQNRHVPQMPTIYVDGGTRFRGEGGGWATQHVKGSHPTVSVGDGDSAPGQLDELLSPDKNFSDLAFALRSLPHGVREITLLGFLGGRRDHELANLGEVHAFLRTRSQFTRVDLVGLGGQRIVAFTRGTFTLERRGEFSVFVLETANVRIEGDARFPLPAGSAPLSPFSSHGLSNLAAGTVQISCAEPCFVITEN